jgi:hypothetical protein
MPGARCTRGLVCNGKKKRTRAYRFSGGTPAFPAQWLDGLWRALPGDQDLFVTVAPRKMAEPPQLGRLRLRRDLTPTMRRQDHTLLPYALAPFVLRAGSSLTGQARPAMPFHADAAASTASHRAFRDDRDPPLFSGETGRVKSLICPTAQAEYFRRRDWTGFIDLPVGQCCFRLLPKLAR